ncbi:MarR family winged helix-turn-helix transcriptional regulator [Streptomyces sp. CB01881]|uniref:MarR family winged helix-turn-helix transcriptional regulator n=1 Tax=Streptomyces sp. CB01881 TaxID=2078691 RepID=UPI000CDBCC80|nr:MarR family winged helix-turn-helix transcriptional regulator [Streptomyces sp. CB01881]AUY51632.1 MarR family transcriptional regulator [Streptomyces sp. CB01881]TYC71066.1 MarR family transcriptional regulator [Streptomyces sp. CB01881]
MADPLPGLSPSEQLLIGLTRLGQAVRLSTWHNSGPTRLTPLQADILLHLAGDPRPRRQGEIVTALASTAPTVSDAVRALAAKELVDRQRDRADTRAVTLTLTEAGRAEAERLTVVPPPLREALDALGDDTVAAMLRGATTMIRVLQQHQAIPVSRTCVTCRFYRPDAHPENPREPHHCAFVDAPFGDGRLRLDCPDHEQAVFPEPPSDTGTNQTPRD